MNPRFPKLPSSLACLLWAFPLALSAQSSPYRGLWVGDVILGGVNEVTVPLDANGVPRAPDPNVATPTYDAANLRLILHVDATGHVSLLKHVAILARKAGVQESESDLALVTNEELYGEFPPQPATRISSVAYDFGDAKATAAVNEIVERAATAAATAAIQNGATKASASSAAVTAATPVIAEANAANRFHQFLQNDLNKTKVTAIADGGSTIAAHDAATALRDSSFYRDMRGIEMLDAIEAALAALPPAATTAERRQAAWNTAAAFAEPDLAYDRFLAGELFGDMISAAASDAAQTVSGLDLKPIGGFLEANGGASSAVTSTAHGLVSGEEVAIQGAPLAAYNGLHSIVRIDDDHFSIAVPFVAGAGIQGFAAATHHSPLRVSSPGHGLASGDRIRIRGSLAAYDGSHVVTVIDGDTFSVDLPFESDPPVRGVWSSRSGGIAGYESSSDGSAPVKVMAPNHGLNNGQIIEIQGAGSASYNGLKTITRIDADSFTINQAFDGNPAEKGTWDVPVAISAFQPPAVLPTLVNSPAHGLSTGDRIVVSGSDNVFYNSGFVVTAVDADHFSIPVAYDENAGDPAGKGAWQPASGGQWRKTAAIRSALNVVAKVAETRTAAANLKVSAYGDTRAPDAVEDVLDAIVRSAALAETSLTAEIGSLAATAGRDALSTTVPRYPRPSSAPSSDYTEFVTSQAFAGSVATAADAAAAAAIKEKSNLLATPTSIRDKALAAAIDAVNPVFAAASRSLLNELPLSGGFGPQSSGLTGEIVLPANHPTNPFRHRRHPDHTVGFDIRRLIDLHFDAADSRPLARAGYGVDRIAGTYDEEIFGLHKPLGPNKDTGLKVHGTFLLNRVSLIDTLNGQ